MYIVEVKNLTKKFRSVTAVDGISFGLPQGKIIGLLGPNGAGKTTTIQMLLDLITPTSGSIRIFGKELHSHREEILNKVNFSSPYVSLPSNLKVWENLNVFANLYGVKNIKAKIAELSDLFGIEDFMQKMTSLLSTGQLTRLNLAKAFLNDPELLLLDEPTASLDPDIADRIRKMLKKVQQDKGVTILYTSHNMVEVEEICDQIIFINKGRIVDEGTPTELVKKYGHRDMNDVFLTIVREGEAKELVVDIKKHTNEVA
ncbi:MAG: ABC transporter ATP-binding protein [bacterium]|nr:ABC transporter ATP-binding protein [bacterium]